MSKKILRRHSTFADLSVGATEVDLTGAVQTEDVAFLGVLEVEDTSIPQHQLPLDTQI
jgi:hypothetical protein